ncbi:MAG TPA: FecR domain-containing protein [Acidobacteriota bacterium]|jgi:hypothetical protein
MSDDYLWNGSGEPDLETTRLEELLSVYRYDPKPQLEARLHRVSPARRFHSRFFSPLAAAALLFLVTASIILNFNLPAPSWQVSRLEGRPRVGNGIIAATGVISEGDWLETDSDSRARIDVGRIGEVQVEPNTRIRMLQGRRSEHRLELARGTMHATIWAPPRFFFVNTPSAVATDLGCAYTLEVGDDGTSVLLVSTGWVGFESAGRESFVPAGGVCVSRPGGPPGTPYMGDASDVFVAALKVLDFERTGADERDKALATLLSEAKSSDGLTLWHLLGRVSEVERGRVYDRMAALITPDKGITREGILKLDNRMLDLWWNQLGLGSTGWWRLWKGPSPFK